MKIPEITIEEKEFRIIYIRFRGSYVAFRKNSRKLFKELFDFATKNNLIENGITKVLTVYDDNPFATGTEKLRTSVAMTVPKDINIIESGNVCILEIKGKFGIGHFEINAKEYEKAWQYMYQKWLFKENQIPRDAAPFEMYIDEPPKNFKDKSQTDIYIPIQ